MSVLWSPAELVRATGGLLRRPFHASGVSIDSRTVKPGDLFVALVGENGDGHRFVADALAKGAAGALVHSLPDGVADDAALLQVADTFAALNAMGVFARARFRGRVAAVTGSVGKTTTKNMLQRALSACGKTWAAEASHNNHWGVPLTLARLPENFAYCVVEIGMNHAGEILPLARMARPDVAVITAVEATHIGYLGSIEAIADEKASLLRALPADGVAVLPAASPLLDRLRAQAGDARVVLFGDGETAEARLLSQVGDAEGSDIVVRIGDTELPVRIAAPGAHMAMNAVAALAAVQALGADVRVAATGLEGFSPAAGRGLRRAIAVPGGEALLLDESYNASAASVKAALAVLALQPAQRRIAVLGDMLELGEAGPGEHLGLLAATVANADLVFACGPLMRALYERLPAAAQGGYAADSAGLAPLVAAGLRPGDTVLVKGSLGSRMKLVVDAIAPPNAMQSGVR